VGEAPQINAGNASVPVSRDDPRAAIARAARATGIDFSYLLAQARLESGLNPDARAATSSAAGLYQFTSGTWLRTLDRHGAAHGMGWAEAAISGGRVSDPALRETIMGLRHDVDASALMAAELASDNRDGLRTQLGREPDAAELYLAHFLGLGGAGSFLSALAADPGQSAVALLPKAAAANRPIFYAGGAPRSVGEVMDLLRGKMANAMEATGLPAGPPHSLQGQGWQSAATGAGSLSTPASAPPRKPMAETLRDTFGLAANGSSAHAPAFVQAAYGKLRGLGL